MDDENAARKEMIIMEKAKGSEMREQAMEFFWGVEKKISRAIGKRERGKEDQKIVGRTFSVVEPAGGARDRN